MANNTPKGQKDPVQQSTQNVLDNYALDDYMVCRHHIGGHRALATVTATTMGGWILFNVPEAASSFGGITAIVGYCFGTAIAILMFTVLGTRLRQIMPWGFSLNDYVRQRFTQQHSSPFDQCLYWLVVGAMVLYMFVYLTAELTAISQIMEKVFFFPVIETSLVVMVVVFIYTAAGGLKATISTDLVQFYLIVPLLFVCFVATIVSLGGLGAAFEPAQTQLPELLSFTNINGLRFALSLLIAFVSAEFFNQANWQRVYACRDEQTVRRSFLGAALLLWPLLLMTGGLGLMAAGRNLEGAQSFFDLLRVLPVPNWLPLTVVILSLALVTSSLDSLLNGLAAVFALDLLRYSGRAVNQQQTELQALFSARVLTMAISFLAIAIATQGYSIVYVFFIADLLCAGLFFPILFSFYSRHQTATNAFFSAVLGIISGLLLFPKPDFTPLFNLPGSGDLLNSFAVALVTSIATTLLWTQFEKKSRLAQPFSYIQLKDSKARMR